MTGLFLQLLNVSITATWVALAVLVLRPLLKKAPKWITCLLWGVVGLRLLLPFSIKSPTVPRKAKRQHGAWIATKNSW